MIQLPAELGLKIVDFLPYADQQRMRRVSRDVCDLIDLHLGHQHARSAGAAWRAKQRIPNQPSLRRPNARRHCGEARGADNRVAHYDRYEWWLDGHAERQSMRQTPGRSNSLAPHGAAWHPHNAVLLTYSGCDVNVYDCSQLTPRHIEHQRVDRMTDVVWVNDNVAIVTVDGYSSWDPYTDTLKTERCISRENNRLIPDTTSGPDLGLVAALYGAQLTVCQETGYGFRELGPPHYNPRFWLSDTCAFENNGRSLCVTLKNGSVERLWT